MKNADHKARQIFTRQKQQTVFTFKNLYRAYIQCRKNKRSTCNAISFEIKFEKNLLKLEEELTSGIYRPNKSICFVVEYPVMREIFASDFRDRVIHHLLYNELEPFFEKKFIHQSYACRKNKGVHRALIDLKKAILKITKNHTKDAYYIHLDIKSFFMSINKKRLLQIITEKYKDTEIVWLCERIIFHDPTSNYSRKSPASLFDLLPSDKTLFKIPNIKGLPIGNLTSQFFANVYMDKLDQFVKHYLKAKYYLRYVDDFIILSESKEELKLYKQKIEIFLKENLKLNLNHNKEKLGKISGGIDWVGYFVKPTHVLVRKRVVKNFKNRIEGMERYLAEKHPAGEIQASLQHFLSVCNSFYGHFRHANSFKLRKHIYESNMVLLKKYLEPTTKNYESLKLKESQSKQGKPVK